jgi:predicted thioesterase
MDDPSLPEAVKATLANARNAAMLVAQQELDRAGEPAPRLGDQLRGGVAQIEVNQLRHLSDTAQGNAVWRIDLPVRDVNGQAQLLHLEVEEEAPARQDGEAVRQWTMRVDLDIQPLGPMHAKVTLIGERVHTVIWAEREHTLALLQGNVDWLQTQLARAGLDASDVQCLAGRPVLSTAAITDAPLVDLTV